MNAESRIEYFQNFADAQEHLAFLEGGAPHDYARDSERTREAATRHGIWPQVEAVIEASRALGPDILATVARGERRMRELEREEPDGFFPPEAGVERPRAKALPGFTATAVWEAAYASPEIIKAILGAGQFTTLFGQSGHFKSVMAIDMAMSAGLGFEYQGQRCARRVGVLYVAGEGHSGIRKRMRAWMMARGFDATSDQPSVYVTSSAADLIGNPDQLRATVEHAATVLGKPIEFIVIDTLAANFGNGDEYHPRDMGLALAGARQAAPTAAVLLVHHTGHGQDERERGSYSLIAAADYRLRASYDAAASKTIELKWLKVKDDETPKPILFAWQAIGLNWKDDEGEEITSVVLDRLDAASAPQQGPQAVGLGKNQETAMKALRVLYTRARKNLSDQGRDPAKARILISGWRGAVEKSIDRNRFHEVQAGLEKRGLIIVDDPHVMINDGPQ